MHRSQGNWCKLQWTDQSDYLSIGVRLEVCADSLQGALQARHSLLVQCADSAGELWGDQQG